MGGDIEWVDAGEDRPASDASDDVVDLGRDRRFAVVWQRWIDRVPRVVRWAVVAAAAAVAAFGYLWPPSPPQRVVPPAVVQAADDGATATVAALARDTRALTSYVRADSSPGACALVPIGTRPDRRLVAAVRATLPDYTVHDVARVLDQFTALCTLQLRADDRRGTTLVVQIAAAHLGDHNAFAQLSIASRTDGVTTVSAATDITTDGWTVTVGSLGPAPDQPPSAMLMQLAQDPALLW